MARDRVRPSWIAVVAGLSALAAVCEPSHAAAPVADGIASGAPCARAFQRGVACPGAVREAGRLFAARDLSGAMVIQDVRTGAVVAYGSLKAGGRAKGERQYPAELGSAILPLSASKLLLAASWWTHADLMDSPSAAASDKDVHDLIAWGSDSAGKRLALDLRHRAGSLLVLSDLERFGFPPCRTPRNEDVDRSFWGVGQVVPPAPPRRPCTSLDAATSDADWAIALSIGETDFTATLLHLSRFVQAVGDDGVMIAPRLIKGDRAPTLDTPSETRIMSQSAAIKLRQAMIDAVAEGTTSGVKDRLRGHWRLGGKTGTGPSAAHPCDGCFVGLAFDPEGRPRFSLAIYVRHGGPGAGPPAEIAADLLNYALGL